MCAGLEVLEDAGEFWTVVDRAGGVVGERVDAAGLFEGIELELGVLIEVETRA
ncbi:hypothetical protein BH24ACT15_BH24ACT15_39190 [soil metagenome]